MAALLYLIGVILLALGWPLYAIHHFGSFHIATFLWGTVLTLGFGLFMAAVWKIVFQQIDELQNQRFFQ